MPSLPPRTDSREKSAKKCFRQNRFWEYIQNHRRFLQALLYSKSLLKRFSELIYIIIKRFQWSTCNQCTWILHYQRKITVSKIIIHLVIQLLHTKGRTGTDIRSKLQYLGKYSWWYLYGRDRDASIFYIGAGTNKIWLRGGAPLIENGSTLHLGWGGDVEQWVWAIFSTHFQFCIMATMQTYILCQNISSNPEPRHPPPPIPRILLLQWD